jgi:site-specific recombinase XerD
MRQVIGRFLRHLDAEKNTSVSTIDTYRYDLIKFDDYLAQRLGSRFLPGDVSRDHIRDYLLWLSEVGHQKPNGPSWAGLGCHKVVFQVCSSSRAFEG